MDNTNLNITFPEVDSVSQGKGEYFFIEKNGKKEKVVYHDYDKIYSIPGLYEKLFYDKHQCNSPSVVTGLLNDYLEDSSPLETNCLNVLDVGAGNGMVGEELKSIGATVTGLDIIKEAADAVERDRPEVYEDYYIADLTNLDEKEEKKLETSDFNCMTVVAALGFDDIPPEAFATAYNFISSPGLLAFNIKENFMEKKDTTGFCQLIQQMIDEDIFQIKKIHRYRHRLCQDGSPLHYYAVVGEKRKDLVC